MKFCNCALPNMTGSSECCKNCNNNIEYTDFDYKYTDFDYKYTDFDYNLFPWMKDGKFYKVVNNNE